MIDILERAGTPIHLRTSGPEDAPAVVFSHGLSMDCRMFDGQVAAVTAAGYRAISWDMRGHGKSRPLTGEVTVPAMAADLRAVLDAVGVGRAVLVGQSLGGYVSQQLQLDDPDRVAALVLLGTTPLTTLPSRLELAALRLTPALFALWPERHRCRLVARHTAVTPQARAYAEQATCQVPRRDFAALWRAVAGAVRDLPDHRIARPLLVAHGEHDDTGIIRKVAADWVAREPCAELVVIPGAGHNANQDNPGAFDRALLRFLARHAPPGESRRARARS